MTLPWPLSLLNISVNLLLFQELHNPSSKVFWLFHLNIKHFQLAKRRKHHYPKSFSYLLLWKPLTIYRKIAGSQSLDWGIHLPFMIKKKVRLVTWKLTTRFIGRNAVFLLESVGTREVPPLTGMSKNSIIFPDSCWIEVKDYLFKLLKHEAKCSKCVLCLSQKP